MSEKQNFQNYLNAYLHFGHSSKEWNPKMSPYILFEKKGYHILDLIKTKQLLEVAGNILEKYSKEKKTILFVGTSKEAAPIIKKYALEAQCFYVNFRWLGGMLTNWVTLQRRIERFIYLENLIVNVEFKTFLKKDQIKLMKEYNTLNKLFEGIKRMKHLPDIIVFTNQNKGLLAVYEALRLGIPCISLVDTNCDPRLIPYPIPTNNKSVFSLDFIVKYLTNRIKTA